MVLLLIKIEYKTDFLSSDLVRIDEQLSSLEDTEGYCAHSLNINLKEKEQLLLIIEWSSKQAVTNYLQTEEFKVLVRTIKKVGKKYSFNVAGILSRGEVEMVREMIIYPPIFEAPQE